MSLLFGPQLFADIVNPLARSVAVVARRTTAVGGVSDMIGRATDCNALPRPLVLLHDPCANHCIQIEKRLWRLLLI